MALMKEGSYGYLERVAFFAFAFGMAGMALTVLAMNLFDDRATALWLLAVWFTPIPICLICWWSIIAKDDFAQLCGIIVVFCILGVFSGEPYSIFAIPLLIVFSYMLSYIHKAARHIINIGRSPYRRI